MGFTCLKEEKWKVFLFKVLYTRLQGHKKSFESLLLQKLLEENLLLKL